MICKVVNTYVVYEHLPPSHNCIVASVMMLVGQHLYLHPTAPPSGVRVKKFGVNVLDVVLHFY